MPRNPEHYEPSPEDIQKAEDMMTPEEKIQSEARAEGFELGQKEIRENEQKNLEESALRAFQLEDYHKQNLEELERSQRFLERTEKEYMEWFDFNRSDSGNHKQWQQMKADKEKLDLLIPLIKAELKKRAGEAEG